MSTPLEQVAQPSIRWDKGMLDFSSPDVLHAVADPSGSPVTVTVPAGTTLNTANFGAPLGKFITAPVLASPGAPVTLDATVTITIPPNLIPEDPDFRVGLALKVDGAEVTLDPIAGMTFQAVGNIAPGVTNIASSRTRADALLSTPVAGTHTMTLKGQGMMGSGRSQVTVTIEPTMFHGSSAVPTYPAPVGAAGDVVTTASITVGVPAVAEKPVLHYRDPADGKFKPLTEVRVRGIVDAPGGIDPATAKIVWGTHDSIATRGTPVPFTPPNPGWGAVPGAMPAAANVRASVLPNGRIRIQADPWQYTGNSSGGFVQSIDPNPVLAIRVPITWAPEVGKGDEMLRLEWTVKNTAGGTVMTGGNGPIGYRIVGVGLAKPGDPNVLPPQPKDLAFVAAPGESSGLGVNVIPGAEALLHDAIIVTFWINPSATKFPDGTHPLTADIPALDVEVLYKLTRQEAAAP